MKAIVIRFPPNVDLRTQDMADAALEARWKAGAKRRVPKLVRIPDMPVPAFLKRQAS